MLQLNELSKLYPGGVAALSGIDLAIPEGMFGLLGPNGAGKSTLMKILAGALQPSSGRVTLDGHDIVAELAPAPGEPVLDKPGKGAFYQTDLELMLRNRGIDTLLVAGVTTEVCVHTTVREANDRGFRCVVLADCCGSYFPEFHETGLKMIAAQGGIFGWVSDTPRLLDAIAGGARTA